MKKIIAILLTFVFANQFTIISFAIDEEMFPTRSEIFKKVGQADQSLFSDSRINSPVNTGFEELDEIESVNSENQDGQISISDDSYAGKFALKINKTDDENILILKTDRFETGNIHKKRLAPSLWGAVYSDVCVEIEDTSVKISGDDEPEQMISLLIRRGEAYVYAAQVTTDDYGHYEFECNLDYGQYYMALGGGIFSGDVWMPFEVSSNDPQNVIGDANLIDVKCNTYKFMIKPMSNAQTISFFVDTTDDNENGEKYALVKSDKNGDGVFVVGEDLARGKWQTIELKLDDIDADLNTGYASSLYMSANEGSQWLIDDMSSEYKKIVESEFDLSEFAEENVIYDEETNTLAFENNSDTGLYNINDRVVTGTIDLAESLVKINVDAGADFVAGDGNNLYFNNLGNISNKFFAEKGKKIFYNDSDDKCIYMYNVETREKTKVSNDNLICASPDCTHFLVRDAAKVYHIINMVTGEKTVAQLDVGDNSKFFFNINNELFVRKGNKELYMYKNSQLIEIIKENNSGYIGYVAFDVTGRYLLWCYGKSYSLFENINGIYNQIKTGSISDEVKNCALSNDASTVYMQTSSKIYAEDVNTRTEKTYSFKKLHQVTDDNMLLVTDEDNYHYLINPITGAKHKIFNNELKCDTLYYSSQTNMLTGILSNGDVFYHLFSAEIPEVRYALSFDGCNNWVSYNGGRWTTVSEKSVPSTEEIRLTGMTAETLNGLNSLAYEKLYSDGRDILTLDIAIYMNSKYSNQTPVINRITVSTEENGEHDGVYGKHLVKYEKANYSEVKSIFPIENFGGQQECYYILYMGNEWLYTYKNGSLIKVEESADQLLSNIESTWIDFKKYGMTAQEVRNIPGKVLTELFVNERYINDEFGIIYVVKSKDDDTQDYTVDFRITTSEKFIETEEVVVEITMNGGEKMIIDSIDYSRASVEKLLNWLEARQRGEGDIFYRVRNDREQHLINYYMINSISIYPGGA